jgi:hypothetical protein
MAVQQKPDLNNNALAAILLAQFRKPHELTKAALLLLVLAHIRMRPGFGFHEPAAQKVPDSRPQRSQRKKGFSIKQPRSRFL